MSIGRRAGAELLGTFWLVLGGVGSAVIAGHVVGYAGVALAFGLTVLTMVYALGRVSGAHLNPAVTVGLAAAGRFPGRDVIPYVVAQVAGAILASFAILLLARAAPGGYSAAASGLGANGYGAHSPEGYSAAGVFFAEVLLTFFFLVVILGTTSRRGTGPLTGVAIGLCLTLIHLVDIPIDNASVNPARSTGPAIFVGGWAVRQLWMFWVSPILGAALAGVSARLLEPHEVERPAEQVPGGAVGPRPAGRHA
jgi:aquaporin Z